MAKMNLTQFAQWQRISTRTAQRWYHEGKLPYPAEKVGRQIFVDVPDEPTTNLKQGPQRTVIYLGSARSRASEVLEWALEHGLRVDETHRESPASEDSSTKLKQLLANPAITRIITDSHPESDLISAALSAAGREFITAKPQSQATSRTFKPRLAPSAGA